MLNETWNWVLQEDILITKSYFFFVFISLVAQLVFSLFFSILDFKDKRISFKQITPHIAASFMVLFPFCLLWFYEISFFEITLPSEAPTLIQFYLELFMLGTLGDFCFFYVHRWMHTNSFLRNNIHYIHHTHGKEIHSWMTLQFHPVEAFLQVIALFTLFLMFAHPMTLWFYAVFVSFISTHAHSSRNFGIHIPLILDSSEHEIHHHKNTTKNYGNILNVWDRLWKTYQPNVEKKE